VAVSRPTNTDDQAAARHVLGVDNCTLLSAFVVTSTGIAVA
jgi:hypothetical protein